MHRYGSLIKINPSTWKESLSLLFFVSSSPPPVFSPFPSKKIWNFLYKNYKDCQPEGKTIFCPLSAGKKLTVFVGEIIRKKLL